MTIDRLGPIDSNIKLNKANKIDKAVKKEKSDSINISSDAKTMAEVYRAEESVKTAPDVRMDRVEEVKAKLQDPSYIDDKIKGEVADKIMDLFGLS